MHDTPNPYAAAPSRPHLREEISSPLASELPSQGIRFVNFIIDTIARLGIEFSIGLCVGMSRNESAIELVNQMPGLVVSLPVFLLYYIVLEGLTGRTIGKWITKTKVVNEDGGTPSFAQVLGRSLCRIIPFEPFSFFNKPVRGWHDSIPKTYVVHINKY